MSVLIRNFVNTMKNILPVYIMNFLLAVSTTIGMTLIPLLATEKLGISLFVLGVIEGGTELLSNILRLVTGNLFDRLKNRRSLFIFPTAIALLSKMILYIPSALSILAAKIMERAANGAFAAPRDAFIGEHAENKGIALGWLSVTKTFGCIIGPLLVSASTLIFGSLIQNTSKLIFLACLMSFISFLCAFFVNTIKINENAIKDKFNFKQIRLFFKPILPVFILSFLFFLGRFNDGIILIFLKEKGFPEWYYLATISFFNTIMLLVSPLLGHYIDRKKENYILVITIIALLSFNILYLNINTLPWLFACLGLVMWGIQRAGAQITFTAMIFKKLPTSYYGTAVGIYAVLSGMGIFTASLICGYLAQMNFNYVFMFSGFFSCCALLLTLFLRVKQYI
jgi:MFS family permease